jgi:hypothetical protein
MPKDRRRDTPDFRGSRAYSNLKLERQLDRARSANLVERVETAIRAASPLLANLYLHWFDALFHGPGGPARWADAKLVRNADDFVSLAKQMGAETTEFIESRLEGKFQLAARDDQRSSMLQADLDLD